VNLKTAKLLSIAQIEKAFNLSFGAAKRNRAMETDLFFALNKFGNYS
jgi:hypothetical protein